MIDSTHQDELKKKMKSYGLVNCDLVLYQGPDSRAAARGMFDELNTDVKLQSLSIKDIYIKMDSLEREVSKISPMDSLQANIAREMLAKDSTFHHLFVQRSFSFNPSKNANDTLWTVTASFKQGVNFFKRLEYEDWFKKRLQSPDVKVTIE
jgi:hypothetical protein